MAAEGIQFPWRWTSGTISTVLDVIWGMSGEVCDKIVRVTEQGRPFVRMVCAGFDSYVRTGEERAVPAV